METENKFYETGSNPYHLNLNGTAKEFSLDENTNPQNGFLDIISRFEFIEDIYVEEVIELENQKTNQSNRLNSI